MTAIEDAVARALDNTELVEHTYDYGYGGEVVEYAGQIDGSLAVAEFLDELKKQGYEVVEKERSDGLVD